MRCNRLWIVALMLAPLAGGCGAVDRAVTRNFYQQASRQRTLKSTLTITRVVNNEPPLVLDEKSLKFEGELAGPSGRVRASYQAGLEADAKTLAEFLEDVCTRTERELGLRLGPGVHLYLLNVDRTPRSLSARLKMKDGAMPYPVFIPKSQAGKSPITQPLLDDLYSLLHELAELTLSWPGPHPVRALADVETSGGWYRVRNHTRWFRDGYANYAAYVGLHEARQVAGERWPKWLTVNSLIGHDRPFSALAEVGPRLFRWDQFSTGNQQRRYEAALGLFLLIEHQHGRGAIRRITDAAAQLEHADGSALVATCSRVLGTDLRKMVEEFAFPDLGLELQANGDNRGEGPDDLRWSVLVSDMKDDGAGARAGFKKGDVILGINGRRVENLLDFELAMMKSMGAPTAEVAVERGRRKVSVTVPTHTGRRGKS